MHALNEPRDELYAAFADVPRPGRLDGCPCCTAPDEGRSLLDRPLRSLTADDLSRYAAKAMTTWAGPEEFRYFAPRLLDLAGHDAFVHPDVEIVFAKLGRAGWRDWPQRDAVAGFLRAFWTGTLARFPARPSASTALCALAGAGFDMAPCLDEWGALASHSAVAHLHEFAAHELIRRRGRPLLANAFWDRSSRQYEQVVAWAAGGPALEAVDAAFARSRDEATLRLLADIDSLLAPP